MHFKHPELLYALFLLVIPVMVHLFQLRKFRPEPFTNVKFLQKAVLQTRKGSQLKKRLILVTRLLVMATLVLGFAQPFFPSSGNSSLPREIVVYLDNSYSMQAGGRNGILLKQGVQQLLEQLPGTGRISLFTNDQEFRDQEVTSIKGKLLDVGYSPQQLDWETVRIKAEGLFSQRPARRYFLGISDFQQKPGSETILPVPRAENFLVKMEPEKRDNISVDSVYILARNPEEVDLRVDLSVSGNFPEEVSVGIYEGQDLLFRKTTVTEGSSLSMDFELPAQALEQGRVQVEDRGLPFDNQLYFSINKSRPIRVLVISVQDHEFLERIFTGPDFDLQLSSPGQLDFSAFSGVNFVILNELKEIPRPLGSELIELRKESVVVVVIPSETAALRSYNEFLTGLFLPRLNKKLDQERLVNGISFDHPLFSSVFQEQIKNFEYPRVQSFYSLHDAAEEVLKLDNAQPFLVEKELAFLFTAPINSQNSNFQASPLIVPTFYNMGVLSLSIPRLYYTLGTEENIELPVSLQRDEIVQLVREDHSFIPRQQSFQNKVRFSLELGIQEPGHYKVVRDSLDLLTLGLNVNREESELIYHDLKASENSYVNPEIPTVFEEIRSDAEVTALWKWFIIFAVIFLLTEMLILKYLK